MLTYYRNKYSNIIVIVCDPLSGKPEQKGWVIRFRLMKLQGLFGWQTGLDVEGSWAELDMEILKEDFVEVSEGEINLYYPQILAFHEEARTLQVRRRRVRARIKRMEVKLRELKKSSPPLECQRQNARKKPQK